MSSTAVATDTAAVMALTTPDTKYEACQTVQISIRWVVPQPIMKIPNIQKTQLKGRSRSLTDQIDEYNRNAVVRKCDQTIRDDVQP